MNTNLNSVSSAETKDEKITNDEVASTVHHHIGNTIVVRSPYLLLLFIFIMSCLPKKELGNFFILDKKFYVIANNENVKLLDTAKRTLYMIYRDTTTHTNGN